MGRRISTAALLSVLVLASFVFAEDADEPDASRASAAHYMELLRMLREVKRLLASGKRDESFRLVNEIIRLDKGERRTFASRAEKVRGTYLKGMLREAKKLLASGKKDEGVRLLKEVMRLDDSRKRPFWQRALYQISLLAWREGRIQEAQQGFLTLGNFAYSMFGRGNYFLHDVTMAATEFDLPRARILLPLIAEEYPSVTSIRLLRTADDEGIRLLDTMLGDADVGSQAADILFWLGEKSLEVLSEGHETPERSAIIEQIQENWGTESAVQELMRTDRTNPHPIDTRRDWAARLVDRLNADKARVCARIEQLFRTHPKGEVRRALSRIAWHLDDPPLVERLIPLAVEDPYAPVRWETADRIGGLGDRKYVPLLKKMIHDPESNVAHNSFQSVGRILGDEAIPWFEGLLRSEERRLRALAVTGLAFYYRAKGWPEYRRRLAEIIDTPGHPARYEVASYLASHKDKAAVPVLLEMVKDQELPDRLRKGAINSLKWHFSIDATVDADED